MANKIITFKDNFQWLQISHEKAIDLYDSIELFEVREDEQSESVITSMANLKSVISQGGVIGIELGHLEESKKQSSISINFTEEDISQMMSSVLMAEDGQEHVFDWAFRDNNDNLISVEITVGNENFEEEEL